jgi:hypothetical protein
VIDALLFKRQVSKSLKTFHAKTQLALLKFEHVDVQFVPRWVRAAASGSAEGDAGAVGDSVASVTQGWSLVALFADRLLAIEGIAHDTHSLQAVSMQLGIMPSWPERVQLVMPRWCVVLRCVAQCLAVSLCVLLILCLMLCPTAAAAAAATAAAVSYTAQGAEHHC